MKVIKTALSMKKYYSIFILSLFLIVTACSTTSTSFSIPVENSDGWRTASLESVSLTEDLLVEMDDRVHSGAYGEIHSILIVKDGSLVFEEYYNNYNIDTVNDLRSCTKSVASTLIGIAIDKDYIISADEKIFSFFPEYANLNNTMKDRIKLTHILSMSSGLDWNEWEYPYNDPRNIWYQMYNSNDWLQFVLNRNGIYEPGERWFYNSGGSMLLSGVIKNSTGLQAEDFARNHLFGPLGISQFQWNKGSGGLNITFSSLYMRPRDMAKIGYLYINNGDWNGTRILSTEWINEALQNRISTNMGNVMYGYQWWKRNFNVNNRAIETFSAEGTGDQYIFGIDSLKMVIVITGGNWQTGSNVMEIIPNYILPSVN
jgi:CubicO group peptidase (beta-lactamase class C family)